MDPPPAIAAHAALLAPLRPELRRVNINLASIDRQ
jgi:hypothetical protein